MKTTVRFLRHGGVYRPMCDLFESLTRSAAFRSGPGQTFRTHRKFLRPAHRRDEPRPAIPQRVARQHCPSPLHRHGQTNTISLQPPSKQDISTLQRIGHFYFALTMRAGEYTSEPH